MNGMMVDEGEWLLNSIHGKGKFKAQDGSEYIGEWENLKKRIYQFKINKEKDNNNL